MEKKPTRKWLFPALYMFIIVVVCVIHPASQIVSYGKVDEKKKADVVIVLGAALSDDELTPVYRERINHGIWLYEKGYVKQIIFTGGVGDGDTVSEAAAAKAYAISKNIPENVIFLEERSKITEQNIENAKVIMDENDMDTAIIVSDPLHMKRAMLMASDYGITAYSSPTPTTMFKSLKTQIPFLAREIVLYIGYSVMRLF